MCEQCGKIYDGVPADYACGDWPPTCWAALRLPCKYLGPKVGVKIEPANESLGSHCATMQVYRCGHPQRIEHPHCTVELNFQWKQKERAVESCPNCPLREPMAQ
jgi:hypothetical protein